MTITDLDDFADPAPARPKLHNGWGQYQLPDPDTGKIRAWSRVTTIAGTLEDRYHLEQWGKRKVLEGLVTDRGIVTQAAAVFAEHGRDPRDPLAKDRLNALAAQAIDTAGAHDGANTGTALHDLTERKNRGEAVEVPVQYSGHLAAYESTLAREGITVLPEYMERIICVPELNAAGRLDNLVREAYAEYLRVFDLKSQKTMDFGALKIAIQLACYAHAYAIFDEETYTWSSPPAMDQDVATVCWLPVLGEDSEKVCQLFDVDLQVGWEWARKAVVVRKGRNLKPIKPRPRRNVPAPRVVSSGPATLTPVSAFVEAVKEELDPDLGATASRARLEAAGGTGDTADPREVDWEARLREARTRAELLEIGTQCKNAGKMTSDLQTLGKELGSTLPA